MRGGLDPGSRDETSFLEDRPSFVAEKSWRQLVDADETLAEFKGISGHMRENSDEWRAFCYTEDPYLNPAPGKWSALRHVILLYLSLFRVVELNFTPEIVVQWSAV